MIKLRKTFEDNLFRGHRCHKIIHKRPPLEWYQGFPLGNGALGAMIWGDGHPLCFTLDHADLWDTRIDRNFTKDPLYNYTGLCRLISEGRYEEAKEIFELREGRDNPIGPIKISIGRLELNLRSVKKYRCHLNLDKACVEGVICTAKAEHSIKVFVHRERNVLCFRIKNPPQGAVPQLLPLAKINAELAKLNHPQPPLVKKDGDLKILIQQVPEGPFYAVVWNKKGPEYFVSVEVAKTQKDALAKAKSTWHQASQNGFDNLYREHITGWKKFWSVSAVFLPEPRMEFLWYYGNYLLASSARKGCLPPGLQGVWAMDGQLPPWRGDYHADMNVQETFWPACASGHLELLDVWCDYMKACIPACQEFTRQFFGTEGTFWLGGTVPYYTSVFSWYTFQFAWSNSGWLAWLAWLRWRYSMDIGWLVQTGYPLIAEIFKFYRANLKPGEDGFFHIPLSASPEYKDNKPEAWAKDPNIDIALIRRCCDWVCEIESALKKNELTPSAKEIHSKLVPYHLKEKTLCLWADKLLDESHRHPSHLMAIHPSMDLTVEGGEKELEIINASIRQYLSLGQYYWGGHTYAQLVSFAANVKKAGWAYDSLLQFYQYWIGPNGLHFNRDVHGSGRSEYGNTFVDSSFYGTLPFTMEANCAVSAGISDMLVQGWEDTVWIFPAVPECWHNIAFRDIVTEGAFKVSAIRREGQTVWIKITAGADRTLRLQNPFGKKVITVTGCRPRQEKGLFLVELRKNQEVTFSRKDINLDLKNITTSVRQIDISRLGLH